MKNIALAVIPILLIAGCAQQADDTKQLRAQFDVVKIDDLILTANSIPSFVMEGNSFDWYFTAKAINEIIDLNIEVFDKCLGISYSDKASNCLNSDGSTILNEESNFCDKWHIDKIKKESMKSIPKTSYKVDEEIDFERECIIKFKADYKAMHTLDQGVTVLPFVEYESKTPEQLLELTPPVIQSKNALKITISFSQTQPLIDDSDIKMYVDYEDVGAGLLESLEANSVIIKIPGNLEAEGTPCDDYVLSDCPTGEICKNSETWLSLSKDIKFSAKSGKRSTCSFKANSRNPVMDTDTIKLEANYEYKILNGEIKDGGRGIEIRSRR